MKKNIKIMALFAVLLTLTLCIFLTSCMEEEFHAVYFASNGGSIVGDISQYVKKGKDATEVTAVANEGFRFTEWSDGLKDAARQDKAITAEVKVTAKFEKIVSEPPIIDPEVDVDPQAEFDLEQFLEELREQLADIGEADPEFDVEQYIEDLREALEGKGEVTNPNEETNPSEDTAVWATLEDFRFTKVGDTHYKVMLINKSITHVVIPSEYNGLPVKEIAASGFSSCKLLEFVHIPASVEIIGVNAFANNPNLKTVEMSKVKTIMDSAFSFCFSLETLYLPATVEYVGGNAFRVQPLRGNDGNITVYVPFSEEETVNWHKYWTYYCTIVYDYVG